MSKIFAMESIAAYDDIYWSAAASGSVLGYFSVPTAGWARDISQDATSNDSRITGTAKTPADYLQSAWYDECVLQARLPANERSLYRR